jgi:hypothetical protein
MTCVLGAVSTENGGTTVYRSAREAANLTLFAVDAVHCARCDRRRRQGESHILGVIDLIDGIGLGVIAVEISLGEPCIRGRRYPEGERATIAWRDTLRHVVHE